MLYKLFLRRKKIVGERVNQIFEINRCVFHKSQSIINVTWQFLFLEVFTKAFGINNSWLNSAPSASSFLKIPRESETPLFNPESRARQRPLQVFARKKTRASRILYDYTRRYRRDVTCEPEILTAENARAYAKIMRQRVHMFSRQRIMRASRSRAFIFRPLEKQPSICIRQFSMLDRMLIQILAREQRVAGRN